MLRHLIQSLLVVACLSQQLAAHSQSSFNASKAIDALMGKGLITDVEGDSLRAWVQSGGSNYSSYFYEVAHPDISSRAGILLSLMCLKGDSIKELESYLSEMAIESSSVDALVSDPIAQRLFRHHYGTPDPGVSFFNEGINYPNLDSITVRQKKLSQTLFEIGLLDDQVMRYQPIVTDFNSDLAHYYWHMSMMCRYVDEFASIREGEIRKCRNLVEAGVLTKDEFNHMQLDYTSYGLMGDFGIIGQCAKGLAISADSLPDDLIPYLESVGQQLLARMPLKGATHFRVREEHLDYPWDYFEYDSGKQYVAYLDHDGKTYAQEFLLFDYDKSLQAVGLSDFRNLFNKLLSEMASDYRLYSMTPVSMQGYSESGQLGFIFLTEAQHSAWMEENLGGDANELLQLFSRSSFSEENHTDAFPPSRVAAVFKELDYSGLFDYLDETRKAKTWDLISKSSIECVGDIVLLIPNFMLELPLSLEGDTPYAELLIQLSEFSGGEFKPTKVKDNYSTVRQGEEFVVTFKLRQKHSITLKREYDWIDPAFFASVAEASQELPARQFHVAQAGSSMMLLTPEQFQLLERIAPELFHELDLD